MQPGNAQGRGAECIWCSYPGPANSSVFVRKGHGDEQGPRSRWEVELVGQWQGPGPPLLGRWPGTGSAAQAEATDEGLNFRAATKRKRETALSHNTLNQGCTAVPPLTLRIGS